MRGHPVTAAPDYTNAALVMLGINLLWIFFAIWATLGMLPVLLIAALLNQLITRLRNRARA